MNDLVSGLKSDDKLKVLKAFNGQYKDFSFQSIPVNVIEDLWDLLYQNLDDKTLRENILLCAKTVARDKKAANQMTPHLFVRLLEIAQLTNIYEGQVADEGSLQARRVVFNITYHNKLCQAACHEASVDINLVEELQSYTNSLDYELRLLNSKLIFLLTAVSELMRARVVKHGGISILTNIMIALTYKAENVAPAKFEFGKKYTRKSNGNVIVLSDEEVSIATDLFMAVFNITLHWDKSDDVNDDSTEFKQFLNFIKFFGEGVSFMEKNSSFINMTVKFLPIIINAASKFAESFVPVVDQSFKGTTYQNRDVELPKHLLAALDAEANKKGGNTMMIISLLSVLTKLCHVRECRKYLRAQVLPSLGKVTKRPEEQNNIKSRIVKLMTHIDNNVSTIASELLFTLCKYNVDRMIKYTGYGNAAGLFNRHGLLGNNISRRKVDMSDDELSDTEEYKECEKDIDLVTAGPARENTVLKNMTEEEKEIEANKLINLIDDMHRKGVIKPGNVGPDGKVIEMDIAEQIARIPEQAEEDSDGEDVDNIKLDKNMFFPRKKSGDHS